MAGRNPNLVLAASRALARSAPLAQHAFPRTPTSHAYKASIRLEEELRSLQQQDPYLEVRQTGTITQDGGLQWGTVRSAITGRSLTISITRLGVPMANGKVILGRIRQATEALG